MKTDTVKFRIYMTLMENENGFLSISDIAKRSFGEHYNKFTCKHLDGLVKRSITHAIAMLSEDERMVIVLKDKTKPGSKIKHKKILGYKILDKDADEDLNVFSNNLNTKKQRLDSARQLKMDFEQLALKNGIGLQKTLGE